MNPNGLKYTTFVRCMTEMGALFHRLGVETIAWDAAVEVEVY